MTTWFVTGTGRFNDVTVEEAEVVSSTEKTVLVRKKGWDGTTFDRRENKRSEYRNYHETREAAIQFLREHIERDVERLKTELQKKLSALGQLASISAQADTQQPTED
jgi:hypothetical protein